MQAAEEDPQEQDAAADDQVATVSHRMGLTSAGFCLLPDSNRSCCHDVFVVAWYSVSDVCVKFGHGLAWYAHCGNAHGP